MPAKYKNPHRDFFDEFFANKPQEFIEWFILHLRLPFPHDEIMWQIYKLPRDMTNKYFANNIVHKGLRRYQDMQNDSISAAYHIAVPVLYGFARCTWYSQSAHIIPD